MASLSDVEIALIIGFCSVGGALLLFLAVVTVVFLVRSRCGGEQKANNDAHSSGKAAKSSSKPPPLPATASAQTSSSTTPAPHTPSTTSSGIDSPTLKPNDQQPQQSPDPLTPISSLIFPAKNSKYAGMRVGRSAWTPAYLPSEGAVQPPDPDNDRTDSSSGIAPIYEGVTSGPYVARAQAGGHRALSDSGSETKLIGAAVEPTSHYSDVAYRGGDVTRPGGHPGRMWPRTGYGPYSPSAMEAARRRTQDLYNARRSQLGMPNNPPAAVPPPPAAGVGRQHIWSGTSGRPQTGSYVIGPRRFDQPSPSFYQPSVGGSSSPPGSGHLQQSTGEASIYLTAEGAGSNNVHTMVVEAAVEPRAPDSFDAPGERHLIGDAFRFLDEFEE